MEVLAFENGSYKTTSRSISLLSRLLPAVGFYSRIMSIIFKAGSKAKRSKYNDAEWIKSSLNVLRALESVGIKVEITGVDNFNTHDGQIGRAHV